MRTQMRVEVVRAPTQRQLFAGPLAFHQRQHCSENVCDLFLNNQFPWTFCNKIDKISLTLNANREEEKDLVTHETFHNPLHNSIKHVNEFFSWSLVFFCLNVKFYRFEQAADRANKN